MGDNEHDQQAPGLGGVARERYRYSQYRDFGPGDPQPSNVLFDPSSYPGTVERENPQLARELDAFFLRFKKELERDLFYARAPATEQPPFFSKPIIKVGERTIPHAVYPPVTVLSRTIEDRQRAIVTCFGVETNQPALVLNHLLFFWFEVNHQIYPLFYDNTVPAPAGLQSGQTTIVPGTLANPFNLLNAGLRFIVTGPALLEFRAQNIDPAVDASVSALMGYYQYWRKEPGEFELGDLQP